MVALQGSIGALNDLIDARTDAEQKPGKPIPAGSVSTQGAGVVVIVGAAVGLGLALPSGPALVVLAVIGLAIGYGYDLRFKGTAWSWVPFAGGIPLLPIYGWLGVTGSMAPWFMILVPLAVVAGSALAVANARADADRDRSAGLDSVAIRLGPDRSWSVNAALLAVVVVVAVGSSVVSGAPWPAVLGAGAGALVVAVGVVVGRSSDPHRQELAWEVEAIGLGILATGWLAGAVTAGLA